MKKNFYAVKRGKVTGIFKSWAECKASVDGFSGAQYKGFVTLAEAEEYMGIGASEQETARKSPLIRHMMTKSLQRCVM